MGNDFGATSIGNIASGWAKVIGSSITGLLIAIMVTMFFAGAVYYMTKSSGSNGGTNRKEVKWFLVNAILILFTVVSIWGIVTFLQKAFLGTDANTTTVKLPSIPISTQTGGSPSSSPNPLGGGSPSSNSLLPVGATCSASSQCASSNCGFDGSNNVCLP